MTPSQIEEPARAIAASLTDRPSEPLTVRERMTAQTLALIIDRMIGEAREEGQRQAEKKVVEWLRLMSDCMNGRDCGGCPGCGRKFAAQSIVAGAHRV